MPDALISGGGRWPRLSSRSCSLWRRAFPVDAATVFLGDGRFGGDTERGGAAVPSAAAIGVFSLLLLGGGLLPVSGLFLTSADRAGGAACLLSRRLRRALGGDRSCRRPSDADLQRGGSRHGGGRCPQRDARPDFPAVPTRRHRGASLMKYIFALWAAPLVMFWGWYFLSLNDINFGIVYPVRARLHDLVFRAVRRYARHRSGDRSRHGRASLRLRQR